MNAVIQHEDDHQPGAKWEFNADVAAKFDSMLQRSIAGYDQMRELVFDLGKRFIRDCNCAVIDLGASRGESVSAFTDSPEFGDAEYFLLEVSEPMLEQMGERFNNRPNIRPYSYDLRKDWKAIASMVQNPFQFFGDAPVNSRAYNGARHVLDIGKDTPTVLVQAILTLIFVPINFRQSILKGVYEGLASGGAFIMVEKVLGDNAEMQELMVDSYHEYKNRHGYSWESIERKRAALEGVQVPLRNEENIAMLRSAGFKSVDTFWRHLNFCGYLCIKD